MELRSLKVAFHHPSGLTEVAVAVDVDVVDVVVVVVVELAVTSERGNQPQIM